MGWRAFNGDMDQVVIWNHPISETVISALCKGGVGSTTVPEVYCGTYASFGRPNGGYTNLLTNFSQTICIKTCFDNGLCCLFPTCETLSVIVTDGNSSNDTLIEGINFSDWPGEIEILEKAEDTVDNCFIYTIRLTLDIEKLFGCPIDIKDKKVIFRVDNPHTIRKPLSPFVITGMKRRIQRKCC
jgi:hypothetical protein